MNLDKFKGKRMVHEDDKKYLEDLVYYHPDPSALWSGDNVEAGYGIDITLTPATTISVDTDVIATKDDLIPLQEVADSYNAHITDGRFAYSIEWSKEEDSAKLEIGNGGLSIYGIGGSLLMYTDEINNIDVLNFNGAELWNVDKLNFGSDSLGVSQTRLTFTDYQDVAHTLAYTDEIKTYTAGTNVSIDANNVISAVDTTYTAGDNITIDANNVISATDTTYSEGTYIDIDAYDEISLDSNAEEAVDTVREHMKHYSIGIEVRNDIAAATKGTGIGAYTNGLMLYDENDDSITFANGELDIEDHDILNVGSISNTNYSLDTDGYLTNNANGDIKFGTNTAQGNVYSDLYMISDGEGWYLETNNANVSTSVSMDTTVMTQDTSYDFKQDGIYLNNNKITGQPAIQTYNLTYNTTYIDTATTDVCKIEKQGNLCIVSCNFATIAAIHDGEYTNIMTLPIKPITNTRFTGGTNVISSNKSVRFSLYSDGNNGKIDVDYTEIAAGSWVSFQVVFFTND